MFKSTFTQPKRHVAMLNLLNTLTAPKLPTSRCLYGNRKEYLAKYTPDQRRVDKENGNIYIFRPFPSSVYEGMICEFWVSKRMNSNQSQHGFIDSVDLVNNRVGVIVCRGGTLERIVWADIEDIVICWGFGTKEYALGLLDAFCGTVKARVEQANRIYPQTKFAA